MLFHCFSVYVIGCIQPYNDTITDALHRRTTKGDARPDNTDWWICYVLSTYGVWLEQTTAYGMIIGLNTGMLYICICAIHDMPYKSSEYRIISPTR